MYFKSRQVAGDELANILFHPYGRSKSIILALGPGSVLVAEPIAKRLQIPLRLLAFKKVELPGLYHESVGTVGQSGEFIYSSKLSEGEKNDIYAEFHGHIDSESTSAVHEINQELGTEGFIDKEELKGKNILIVSDGLKDPEQLDVVVSFLKPIDCQRIVGITPIASLNAIDRLHIVCDEIRILSPKENYLDTDHYYEDNSVPDNNSLQEKINKINSSYV